MSLAGNESIEVFARNLESCVLQFYDRARVPGAASHTILLSTFANKKLVKGVMNPEGRGAIYASSGNAFNLISKLSSLDNFWMPEVQTKLFRLHFYTFTVTN